MSLKQDQKKIVPFKLLHEAFESTGRTITDFCAYLSNNLHNSIKLY